MEKALLYKGVTVCGGAATHLRRKAFEGTGKDALSRSLPVCMPSPQTMERLPSERGSWPLWWRPCPNRPNVFHEGLHEEFTQGASDPVRQNTSSTIRWTALPPNKINTKMQPPQWRAKALQTDVEWCSSAPESLTVAAPNRRCGLLSWRDGTGGPALAVQRYL